MHMQRLANWLAMGGLLLATSMAAAGVSPVIFRIEASNALGTDTWTVSSADLVPDPGTGGQMWTLAGAHYLKSSLTNTIATLNAATLAVTDDPLNYPGIMLNFQIRAGSLDTVIHITSAMVSFGTLPASETAALCNAGFTLTDFDDNVPAQLASMNPGAGLGIYTAQYNGMVPTGTTFANLAALYATDHGGTATASYTYPAGGGFQPLGVPLSNISVACDFTLTAKDLMSGDTTYYVMPEPAALLLLGLLAGLRVRR